MPLRRSNYLIKTNLGGIFFFRDRHEEQHVTDVEPILGSALTSF